MAENCIVGNLFIERHCITMYGNSVLKYYPLISRALGFTFILLMKECWCWKHL